MTPEDNRPATKQDLDRAVESIAAAIQAAEDRSQEFARGIERELKGSGERDMSESRPEPVPAAMPGR